MFVNDVARRIVGAGDRYEISPAPREQRFGVAQRLGQGFASSGSLPSAGHSD